MDMPKENSTMNSVITCPLLTGLGDMYSALYMLYHRQEELKILGYKVKTYVSCWKSFYTSIEKYEDTLFLEKIFNFSLFDDYEILINLDTNLGNFPNSSDYKLVNNYLNSIRCYLEKGNSIDSIDLFDFGNVLIRDDLNKFNLFNKEIQLFCESEIKKFPNTFLLIHYRQHENQDIDEYFNSVQNSLQELILENSKKNIVFITSSEKVKTLVREMGYKNVFFNEYKQNDVWITNLSGEKLIDHIKHTLVDMYLVSYAEKIIRFGVGWNSNFLFYGSTNNKTLIPNQKRFYN